MEKIFRNSTLIHVGTLTLLGLSVFVFALTVTMNTVSISSKAAETTPPHTIPVLQLAYYPPKSCFQAQNKHTGSLASSSVLNSNPSGAIDGNTSSGKWAFYQEPYKDQYLQIDYGTSRQISAISLYFWSQDRPQIYRVLVSDDPSFSAYTTPVTETDGLHGYSKIAQGNAIEKKTYIFPTETARYVRFIIDDYRTTTNPDSGQVNLYEIEAYQSVTEKQCLDMSITGDLNGIISTADMPDPLSDIKNRVQTLTGEIMTTLTNGTKYHGYKNALAPAYLNYQVVDQKEYIRAIPASTEPQAQAGHRPDYRGLLTEANICHYVDDLGVKEVWFWGYHNESISPPIAPSESNMSMGRNIQHLWNNGNSAGPQPNATFGDVSNGEHIDDLPICNYTYTLYNYTYQPNIGNKVHNHLHQLENLLGYANRQLFWYAWGGKQYWEEAGNWICGNAHFTPNSSAYPNKADVEYRYDLSNPLSSSCENWSPDGTGTPTSITCSNWGCTEVGYYTWWMQNIPGYQNGLTYQDKVLTNWWDATYDFDSFYNTAGNPLIALPPTATPSPTQTPIPTETPTPSSTPIPSNTPTPTNTLTPTMTPIPPTRTLTPTPNPVSFIQSIANGKTNTSSITTSSIGAGTNNVYVAIINTSSPIGVRTISGLGLSWSKQLQQCSGRNNQWIEIWSAAGSPTSSGSLTVTLTSSVKSVSVIVSRYAGASNVVPFSNMTGANTRGQDTGLCSGGIDRATTAISLNASMTRGMLLLATGSRTTSMKQAPVGFTQRNLQVSGSGGSVTSLYVYDKSITQTGSYAGNSTLSSSTDWIQAGLFIRP